MRKLMEFTQGASEESGKDQHRLHDCTCPENS